MPARAVTRSRSKRSRSPLSSKKAESAQKKTGLRRKNVKQESNKGRGSKNVEVAEVREAKNVEIVKVKDADGNEWTVCDCNLPHSDDEKEERMTADERDSFLKDFGERVIVYTGDDVKKFFGSSFKVDDWDF